MELVLLLENNLEQCILMECQIIQFLSGQEVCYQLYKKIRLFMNCSQLVFDPDFIQTMIWTFSMKFLFKIMKVNFLFQLQLGVSIWHQQSAISLCLLCLIGFWLCLTKLTNLSFKSILLWSQQIPFMLSTLESFRLCSTALWLLTRSTFHFTDAKMSTVSFVSSMKRRRARELSVSSVTKATLLMIIKHVKLFLLKSNKYSKNLTQSKALQWYSKESFQES